MLCGIAQSLPQMVLARLLQGACGAALVPMSQAVMLDIYPREQLAKAMSIWVTGVTIGPIMGPALGGWLTDNYNWRWVFYINVPFGIIAFLGVLTTLPKSTGKKSPFDFFGFATLSLAVGALQITLDRGQLKDWFNSPEICIEAALSAASFYLFIVHMITTRKTRFVDPSLFKDRNFVAGLVFIFNVGLLLFATLALLPPLLQDLMNYPVVTTGLVTAPRGVGTLLAMLIISRLSKVIDVRMMIGFGFALSAFSAWQMSGFDLQMDMYTVDVVGHRARLWHRARVRASRGRGIRDVEIVIAQRRCGHVQPVAQPGLEHRHLGRRDAAHAQHPEGARIACPARHAVQPAHPCAVSGRSTDAATPVGAECPGDGASRHDCV